MEKKTRKKLKKVFLVQCYFKLEFDVVNLQNTSSFAIYSTAVPGYNNCEFDVALMQGKHSPTNSL